MFPAREQVCVDSVLLLLTHTRGKWIQAGTDVWKKVY